MEKVPQIVSERLRAALSAVGHPDADVLTAFSEHSLRKAERAAVVEHLARCGECREIVALALPATESVQQTVRPASSTWLTWPVLRWGFIAAGVVAIASFGVMRYQRQASTKGYQTAIPEAASKEAKNLPPSPTSPEPMENADKAAAAPSSTPANRKVLSSSSAGSAPLPEMPPPALGGPVQPKRAVVGGTLAHGPRVQWQQNANVQQQAIQAPGKQLRGIPQNLPASPNSETVDVESAAGAVSTIADSSAVQNKIDRQALQHGLTDTRVERSKPAAATVATASQPMVAFSAPNSPAKAQLTRQVTVSSNTTVRWTISAAGSLQRSLDQGTSWQDIDVDSPSAMGGAGVASMRAPTKAKELDADSLAKKGVSTPLVFRAVASNGPDVWAGASGGFLYHSSDSGGSWTRVVPSASGVSLTGDIVSVEFVDTQHGRVVTSTPEVWTTSDAGQSWQKQ